ncbi:hypothetical protein Taro_045784 [Colocasia esculenta]|uniref:riboflavin kinase n=1 Tax=Colocasia esculenta TaxID=4460 RepID=A0A843WXF1_COLES|nr:hypothetical protein [Colocasia esculenta]
MYKACIIYFAVHAGWKGSFTIIIGGDEVKNGKPSPEIFLEAAKRMNADPSCCLVVEDSLPGVEAGKAAGMKVVAVPSIPKQTMQYSSADEVINSLLDLRPEKWGLPPFNDWIDGTLPIEPWYIGGPVIKGFGRGSKMLGIPTANLSAENFSDILSEQASGVYLGWARLSTKGFYKMVMSIGWNPYFNNTEKTIEPWLLHEFEEDFYGEELSLAIIGYIRPEANFPSLEILVERIHEDGRVAEKALDLPIYAGFKDASFLKSLQTPNIQNVHSRAHSSRLALGSTAPCGVCLLAICDFFAYCRRSIFERIISGFTLAVSLENLKRHN